MSINSVALYCHSVWTVSDLFKVTVANMKLWQQVVLVCVA